MSNDAYRITLDQLGRFLTQLGLDWTPNELRSVTIEPGKVTVVRTRYNEDGRTRVLPGHDEPASEIVTIPVVER